MNQDDPLIVRIEDLGVPTEGLAERELTTEERDQLVASIRDLDLMSCFVGNEGCCDPECWSCHSPLRPENLRCLAQNLATAAHLCFAWQLRDVCPTWVPGCGESPSQLPPYMEAAFSSPHIGAFLRGRR